MERYVAQNVRGVQVQPAGQAVLTNRAADYMAVNSVTSFAYTLAVIGFIHSALFMSVKAGLLSLVPNVVPVILSFGVMGLLDIPLSTGTAMVATIAIGITVDDTVHNMVTYSRQLNEHLDERNAGDPHDGDPVPADRVHLDGAGAGFGVMAFSQFVPTVHLALMSAFVMIAAMVSELVLSPILMASTRLVTVWDMIRIRMNAELLRRAPLLDGLSRWEARKVVSPARCNRSRRASTRSGGRVRDTALYMVVAGRLVVIDADLDGERTLAIVEPGGVFGETGMVSDGYRTFSARAESATRGLAAGFRSARAAAEAVPLHGGEGLPQPRPILGERLQDTTTAMLYLSSGSDKPRT